MTLGNYYIITTVSSWRNIKYDKKTQQLLVYEAGHSYAKQHKKGTNTRILFQNFFFPIVYLVEESQSLLVLDYVINFYDTRFQIRYIFCDFLNFECYFYPSSFYRGESLGPLKYYVSICWGKNVNFCLFSVCRYIRT